MRSLPLRARSFGSEAVSYEARCFSILESEHDPKLRPSQLQEARDLLQRATTLDPHSASAFWHLATVQSSLRDVDASVLSAKQAVELAPGDVRTWHLLGLMLTAQENWDQALEILDIGLLKTTEGLVGGEFGEGPGASDAQSRSGEGGAKDEVLKQDFAEPGSIPRPQNGSAAPPVEKLDGTLLEPRIDTLPSASSFHYIIPSVPFQTTSEKFDASIQLLLTQLALSEKYEGAERANERWPDVFSFFSSHCPSSISSGELSRRTSSII